jgi:hypothetical protein
LVLAGRSIMYGPNLLAQREDRVVGLRTDAQKDRAKGIGAAVNVASSESAGHVYDKCRRVRVDARRRYERDQQT